MHRLFRPRVRASIKNFLRHRPALERLEPRLPPGDAFFGMLLALPDSPIRTHEIERDIDSTVKWKRERAVSPIASPPTLFVGTGHTAMNAVEPSSSPTTDPRAAGLDPDVRPAGFNPAARQASTYHETGATIALSDIQHAAARIPSLAVPRIIPSVGTVAMPILPNSGESQASKANTESKAMKNYGNLPLTFEANHGQTDASVDFITRTGGATMYVTPTALVMALPGQRSEVEGPKSEIGSQGSVFQTQHSALSTQHFSVHMQILGANPDAQPTGINQQPGIVNYFIGNDPNQWHANIPTFDGVHYDDVYPGIDLAYYSAFSHDQKGALEYDFIVSPGADPNAITLNFAGADGVEINEQGDLVLHTSVGDVVQQKPFTYQDAGNTRQEVASRYVVDGTQVRFDVGAYDATRPLVIDPLVMGYSTYLGGSLGDDAGLGIAVDSAGNAYVSGATTSPKFPTTPGAFDTTSNGDYDAFAAKLSGDGSILAYATYLGGSNAEIGRGIAVDATGNAYLTGYTGSSDFPTTPGAFDNTYNGGSNDPFVAKLNSSGSILDYGTYLGGFSGDYAWGITVDGAGSAYVTGYTRSPNFPTTPGSFDTSFNGFVDAFVAKLSADGTRLGYATYLGGSSTDYGEGIAMDAAGNAYVTGYTGSTNFPTTPGAFDTTSNGSYDAFVAKLSSAGTALSYSTYLGGSIEDESWGITVDTAGNAYVIGDTSSTNFPATPGAFDTTSNGGSDVFVTKLSGDGSSLLYGTYLGGSVGDNGWGGIAVDTAGNAYVTGDTSSTNFPTTQGAFDISYNGGDRDAFVAKLSGDGSSLLYGTYLGGSNGDSSSGMAVDTTGSAYVTGSTWSTEFPTTPGALKRRNRGWNDAFVTKFAEV